jgi:hypothetical protein
MTTKLEALKAAFAQKTTGNENNSSSRYFRFWSAPEDSTSIFRFLPDADENNPMGFLVENVIHELWVNGEKKRIPCLKMYGESSCPCCTHSAELYAKAKECEAAGDLVGKAKWEAEGKKFYKKVSYIGQGIVIESPVEHDQEQLVKLVDFGPQIYKIIQASFQSGDLEKEPYDFFEGYHFRFKKTKSGENNSYTTSSFAPKQSALSEDVIAGIELLDLKTHRQRPMSMSEVETLLLAAKTGGNVAAATPKQVEQEQQQKTATSTTTTTEETTSKSEEPAATSASNSNVLAQLRERAKQKAAQTASQSEDE